MTDVGRFTLINEQHRNIRLFTCPGM